MHNRDQKFNSIRSEYALFEKELKESGKGLVYRTEKGIYGTSNLDNIFKFFKEICLKDCKKFLDLGCGDGRVVLTASLFTKAVGIEHSGDLIDSAILIRERLGIDCELIQGDYLDHDFSSYDVIFINPDHNFAELDEKLKREMRGDLFVYNEIFAPESLVKGKKFWAGQSPIVNYTNL
ncbi:class I SAM-dependent methyltransferase [Candidatus Woesearchaeota archaeon]|nr:class I SAM-dependent methyltransferase [Candidatus Woesearchaeota archaeon]